MDIFAAHGVRPPLRFNQKNGQRQQVSLQQKNGLRFNQKSFAFRIHLRISHSHASSCSSSSSSPFLLLVPPPHHSFFISSPPSSLRSSTPSFSYYVPLSSAPSSAARASSYALFKVCVWVGPATRWVGFVALKAWTYVHRMGSVPGEKNATSLHMCSSFKSAPLPPISMLFG